MNAKKRVGLVSSLFVLAWSGHASQTPAPTQEQPADIRAELRAIDYRHYRDLDDYLARCDGVRRLLPSLEAFYKQGDLKLQSLRAKHRDNPDVVKLGDFIASINSLDEAGERLLRKEMVLASEMSKLPPQERGSFFERQIRPIEAGEDDLIEREIRLAQEARKDGMHLPDFVARSLPDSE